MHPGSYRVAVARTWQQAGTHRHAWSDLCERRLESNLFLRPEFLLPLLRHDNAREPLSVVFVYDASDRLVGVAALAQQNGTLAPLGNSVVSTCEHPLLFDATPLLDREQAAGAAGALWDWLRGPDNRWLFVRWSRVRLDSLAWRHLAARIDATGVRWWPRRVYRRPTLELPASWDEYLAGVGYSCRKRLRRIDRQLRNAGSVDVRVTESSDDSVVDRFLTLERAGWKGDAGTALGCDPAQEAFFRAACAGLGARDACYFVELLLDGQPIAMTANFVDGERLYAYKTAYDPECSRYSPGIAIESELIRSLQRDRRAVLLDSCAEEDSHLAGIWPDRAPIGDVLVATGAWSGLPVVAAPHVRRSRRLARRVWDSVRTAAG